jgi:hypothetical protein
MLSVLDVFVQSDVQCRAEHWLTSDQRVLVVGCTVCTGRCSVQVQNFGYCQIRECLWCDVPFVQGNVHCSGRTSASVRSESVYGVMFRLYRAMFSAGAELRLVSDQRVFMV